MECYIHCIPAQLLESIENDQPIPTEEDRSSMHGHSQKMHGFNYNMNFPTVSDGIPV